MTSAHAMFTYYKNFSSLFYLTKIDTKGFGKTKNLTGHLDDNEVSLRCFLELKLHLTTVGLLCGST